MTKKQQRMLNAYYCSTAIYLRDVYKSWSAEKERAYRACLDKAIRLHAIDYRICSANSQAFTFAFEYIDEQGRHSLDVETAWSSYKFCID